MNERYVAIPFGGEDDPWGVWDAESERWVTGSGNAAEHGESPLMCSENGAFDAARRMNENICALCGNQCGEAHANVRVGRVCESCADHRLDSNGEIADDPPPTLQEALKIVLDFLAPRAVAVRNAYEAASKLDDAVAVVEAFEDRLRQLEDARTRRTFPPQDVTAYSGNAEAVTAVGFTLAEVVFHAPEGRCIVTYCCPDCGMAVEHCACDGPAKQFVIPAAEVDFGGAEPTTTVPGFGPMSV